MQELMLDLETLGTKPGCVILSVGAVLFDRREPLSVVRAPQFYFNVGVLAQLFAGLDIEDQTAEWWQDDKRAEARRVFDELPPTNFRDVNDALSAFTDGLSIKRIWTRGNFDGPIYDRACEAFDVKPFWFGDFRCFRDVRTALDVLGYDEKAAPVQQGAKHNALEDAKYQAMIVASAHNRIFRQGFDFTPKPRRDDDPVPATAILDESGFGSGMGVEAAPQKMTVEDVAEAVVVDPAAIVEDAAQAQPETVAAIEAEAPIPAGYVEAMDSRPYAELVEEASAAMAVEEDRNPPAYDPSVEAPRAVAWEEQAEVAEPIDPKPRHKTKDDPGLWGSKTHPRKKF